MLTRSLTSIALGSSLLFACASTNDQIVDELAGESSADDAIEGKADAAVDGSYTYFSIEKDFRKCSFPLCSGFYVSRLNRTTTKCEDNSHAAQCYTPVLDWSESGLSFAQQEKLLAAAGQGALSEEGGVFGIVRGRFAHTNDTIAPNLGRFVVTEAWVAEGEGITDGVFARVKDSGIRCITSPCPSVLEKGLNTSRTATIHGVDFAPSGLPEEITAGFWTQMTLPSGIIVAGDRITGRENGQKTKGRTATNVFSRLADAPADPTCFVGGCSGQICSDDEGVISTCEWREEYACYQTATCERQVDGACGWTATPELEACLAPTAN